MTRFLTTGVPVAVIVAPLACRYPDATESSASRCRINGLPISRPLYK